MTIENCGFYAYDDHTEADRQRVALRKLLLALTRLSGAAGSLLVHGNVDASAALGKPLERRPAEVACYAVSR